MGLLRSGATVLALAASVLSSKISSFEDSEITTETLTKFVFTCPCDSTTSVSLGISYPRSSAGVSEDHDWHGWNGIGPSSYASLTSTRFTTTVSGKATTATYTNTGTITARTTRGSDASTLFGDHISSSASGPAHDQSTSGSDPSTSYSTSCSSTSTFISTRGMSTTSTPAYLTTTTTRDVAPDTSSGAQYGSTSTSTSGYDTDASSTSTSIAPATTTTVPGVDVPISPGTPFVAIANIGPTELRRRDTRYLTFQNGQGVLVADSTQAVPLTLSSEGTLQKYDNRALVGSFESSGVQPFEFVSGTAVLTSDWFIGGQGLQHASVSFCLRPNSAIYVSFDTSSDDCTPFDLVPTTDCSSCNLGPTNPNVTVTTTNHATTPTTTADSSPFTSGLVTTSSEGDTWHTSATTVSNGQVVGDSTTSASPAIPTTSTVETTSSSTIETAVTTTTTNDERIVETTTASTTEPATMTTPVTTTTTTTFEEAARSTSESTSEMPATTTSATTTLMMSITTSDSSSTTLSADASMPTAGQPFSITVDTGNPLNKRDIMVVGFVNGQLVLVSSPADAVAFVLTPSGVLMIFNTGLVVGFGGGSGTSSLMIYSSVAAMPTVLSWSFSGGALVLPGAGFCVGAGNVMAVNVGTATDSNCAPVAPKANTAVDSYNTNVANTVTPSPQTMATTTGFSTTTLDATTTTSETSTTTSEVSTTTTTTSTSDTFPTCGEFTSNGTPVSIYCEPTATMSTSETSTTSESLTTTTSESLPTSTSGISSTTSTITTTTTTSPSTPTPPIDLNAACTNVEVTNQIETSDGLVFSLFFSGCGYAIPAGVPFTIVSSNVYEFSDGWSRDGALSDCAKYALLQGGQSFDFRHWKGYSRWECNVVDEQQTVEHNGYVSGFSVITEAYGFSLSNSATDDTTASSSTTTTISTTSTTTVTTTSPATTTTSSSGATIVPDLDVNATCTNVEVDSTITSSSGALFINTFSGCGKDLNGLYSSVGDWYYKQYDVNTWTRGDALSDCADFAISQGSKTINFQHMRTGPFWFCWTYELPSYLEDDDRITEMYVYTIETTGTESGATTSSTSATVMTPLTTTTATTTMTTTSGTCSVATVVPTNCVNGFYSTDGETFFEITCDMSAGGNYYGSTGVEKYSDCQTLCEADTRCSWTAYVYWMSRCFWMGSDSPLDFNGPSDGYQDVIAKLPGNPCSSQVATTTTGSQSLTTSIGPTTTPITTDPATTSTTFTSTRGTSTTTTGRPSCTPQNLDNLLIANKGFETGDLAPWTIDGGVSATVQDSENLPAHGGCWSTLFEARPTDEMTLSQTIETAKGQVVTFSFWVRPDIYSNSYCSVKVSLQDATAGYEPTTAVLYDSTVNVDADPWEWKQVAYTALSGRAQTTLNLKFDCDGSFFVDDFAVSLSDGVPAVISSTTATSSSTTTTTTSSMTTTASTTTTTTSCPTATTVTVTFNEIANTVYGENLFITGSISQLGNWNTDSGNRIGLRADKYTSDNNLWYLPLDLPAGTSFEYKYYRVGSNNQVVWESGNNRKYTVPVGCATSASVNDSWK